jgi:hypothetical protein
MFDLDQMLRFRQRQMVPYGKARPFPKVGEAVGIVRDGAGEPRAILGYFPGPDYSARGLGQSVGRWSREGRSCYGCRPHPGRENLAPLMQPGERLPICAAVRLDQAQVMSESGPRQEPVEQVNDEGNSFPHATPRRCHPQGKAKMVADTPR